MKTSSAATRILLSIGMVASSSIAFAATSDITMDALSNSSAGSSRTVALLLAGLGLIGTIARRRKTNQS